MPPISVDFGGYELYSSDAKCPCELYIKFQSENDLTVAKTKEVVLPSFMDAIDNRSGAISWMPAQ